MLFGRTYREVTRVRPIALSARLAIKSSFVYRLTVIAWHEARDVERALR